MLFTSTSVTGGEYCTTYCSTSTYSATATTIVTHTEASETLYLDGSAERQDAYADSSEGIFTESRHPYGDTLLALWVAPSAGHMATTRDTMVNPRLRRARAPPCL